MNDQTNEWKSSYWMWQLINLRLRKVCCMLEPTKKRKRRLTALLTFYGKVHWVDPCKVGVLCNPPYASWYVQLGARFERVPCIIPVHGFLVLIRSVCVNDRTKNWRWKKFESIWENSKNYVMSARNINDIIVTMRLIFACFVINYLRN